MSVERDLLVNIPDHGYDKLNHAYAFGGERLAKDTFQQMIGLPVDHVVVLEMDGFRAIVGGLGGVDITVEKEMDYDDPTDDPPLHIHLKKGRQRLNAQQALDYVRFRNDAESNNGRMRRQRQMVQALTREVLQPANILRLPHLVQSFYRAVRTDLSLGRLVQLTGVATSFKPDNIVSEGALAGRDFWHNGVSYQRADLVELRTKAYRFLYEEEPPADFVSRAKADQATYDAAAARSRINRSRGKGSFSWVLLGAPSQARRRRRLLCPPAPALLHASAGSPPASGTSQDGPILHMRLKVPTTILEPHASAICFRFL